MPNAKDLVIFTQTYDLLCWLLPQCERFPKSQRFVVTQRLQSAALGFQEAIFEANARRGTGRLQHLQAADAQLNKLRLYLRLARQWDWLAIVKLSSTTILPVRIISIPICQKATRFRSTQLPFAKTDL